MTRFLRSLLINRPLQRQREWAYETRRRTRLFDNIGTVGARSSMAVDAANSPVLAIHGVLNTTLRVDRYFRGGHLKE